MDGIRIGELPRARETGTPAAGTGGAAFADALGQALGAAERLQLSADGEVQRSAMGAGNLHETALALEKADVAMRVATKVRNKLVEAYQEVMRMTV
ncbi:MAG TPA: flagellar hook-basal body complex protein FliE [Anaeromyxobacteraceae bacterium]|nr:flagellar hook-basal body complex protein FliE [Anaeromyxobacteraceae bacterium]